MPLPNIKLKTISVELGDQTIEVHGLTRSQALHLTDLQDKQLEGEAYILACGTDETEENAKAWLAATDINSTNKVLEAILEVSGLTEESKKE